MRATNYKHYGCDNNSVSPKRTRKTEKKSKRKGFKALSYAIAVSLAAVALVVPTTTLAPDVDAFEDSRAAYLQSVASKTSHLLSLITALKKQLFP